ncbi:MULTISPECIES: hypothetical protein [unclassified Burkholderia]|uniref:hypothetical protein n=1 Tax=unclassified Burkholderia TaxID=2613784 RepID=UPI002ABDAA3C|nr:MULTISPECIES: hypothetical protein [unclassified Burkholderia]
MQVTFYESAQPAAERTLFTIKTLHLPRPESHESTHYFIVHCRDFGPDDEPMTQLMHERLFTAFREDVQALELLEDTLRKADDPLFEISVARATRRRAISYRQRVPAGAFFAAGFCFF